jgi:hypothetical protein
MNTNTQDNHFIFHAQLTTGVYAVCFDVFRYLSRRGNW